MDPLMLLVFRAHTQLAISAGGIQASLVFMVLFSAASCVPARLYVHARMFIGRPLTQPAEWLKAQWLKTRSQLWENQRLMSGSAERTVKNKRVCNTFPLSFLLYKDK